MNDCDEEKAEDGSQNRSPGVAVGRVLSSNTATPAYRVGHTILGAGQRVQPGSGRGRSDGENRRSPGHRRPTCCRLETAMHRLQRRVRRR